MKKILNFFKYFGDFFFSLFLMHKIPNNSRSPKKKVITK